MAPVNKENEKEEKENRKEAQTYNITADEEMKPIVSNNMVSVREEDGETGRLRHCDSVEIEQVEEVEQC